MSTRPGRAGESRLTWRELGRGALVALLVLGLGLLAAVQTQRLANEEQAAEDRIAVATTSAAVAVDLEHGLSEVADLAVLVPVVGPGATGPRFAAGVPGVRKLGFIAADPSLASAGSALTSAQQQDPVIAALLDRTRDSGAAEAATDVELDDISSTLLVAAVYEPGATPPQLASASDRRARLQGWVVAIVDLEQLVAAHQPEGVEVAVVGGGDDLPALPVRFASQRIEVHGQPVLLVGGDPDEVGLSTAAIAVTLLSVVVGLVVGGVVATSARRNRDLTTALARSEAQVQLIGDVAPLVQQSLELAEVLPAVAVQLSDHFELAGVGLSTGSGSAGQVELFRLGTRADPPARPVLRPPEHLAAGEPMTLALQRGGRSVALLELVPGRALDASDLRSLQAISELVTAAVVNASLYASQQAAVRRLRDLDALKTVFLSTASHELRTPATAISGFASLLTSGWDQISEEQRQDFIARIAANARSLSAVVQDLLDFSLLDREEVPLSLAPVDLEQVVRGVIDRLAPMFADHTISFTAEPAPLVEAELNGLERVVTNLLTNAAKFSPPGSIVTVAVGPQAEGAEVVVSDQGPGVPPEERQRVFTRFYRGSGDVVVKTRGVGIGLSVVAELVERMQGRIELDDAPGGGARFAIWLPRGTVTADEEVRADATTG